ncbi:KIF-binding protein [Pseudoscourfieldia marina]
MSLSSTWAEVSRLSSLVDPEHTPLRSKEISVDIIREALAARNVRSSDCKPSLINGEPHERVTTAILACKLGSLLTQCEALTEGAAFCRLGLGVLHSEIAMCAGDECREGAADVLRCHVNATEPVLEAASCAGASHAELERNEEALQTLERAAQAAEAAEADQPAENTSSWPDAWAWLASAQRPGGDASRAAATQVFFYLAQVHGNMRQRHESARYCALTLNRQLDAVPPDVRWARNCLGLSAYYANERRFGDAAQCIAAALAAARATAARGEGQDEDALDVAADCYVSRAGLAETLLSAACQDAAQPERGDGDSNHVVPVQFAVGNGDAVDDGWDMPPKTWAAAAKLYNAAAASLSAAFNRYVIDGFVTEHVGCIVQAAKVSRAMARWLNEHWTSIAAATRLVDARLGEQASRHRMVAALHARAVARARPLLGKLNSVHFSDLSVALWELHAAASREAAEAYACAAAASRQGGSRDAADSFTRRERRRWRDAARSSRALAEHLVVDGGGAPASSSASQSEAPTTIPSPMVSSSILVKDSQRIQSCAETRSAASAAVAAARAHHRCAEATERCADASSRLRQVYAHERCALELFKAACYGEDGVDGDVDDSLTEEQKERATTLFREEMNLAKEMAELLPMKVAQLKKRLD